VSSIRRLDCPTAPLTAGPAGHFFGYYDKSPWARSGNGPGVLTHQVKSNDRMPEPGEAVELGIVGADGAFQRLADSRAWNFQQGSMLQWVPGRSDAILFNDIEDGVAIGVKLDLTTGTRTTLPRPFASVSPNGREALSLNYGRLTTLKPEYGYAGLADPFAADPCPADDGIWHFDLEGGAPTLLLSLRQIAEFQSTTDPAESVHYLNHVMYSQTGKRFCFLHRYINAAGTQNTRMFSCNADGSDLRLLISGLASHFGWRGDTELLAWAGERALIGSATGKSAISRLPIGKWLKKLYRMLGKPALLKARLLNDRYILFDVTTGAMTTVGSGLLTTDGHCSFSPDGEWFVTDTYPDKNGNASLLVCRWSDKAVFEVGRFNMPPRLDNEVRCDLHPRWHPTDMRICVDVAGEAARQMISVDVSALAADSASASVKETA